MTSLTSTFALKLFIALVVAREANNLLSRGFLNNFCSDSYDWRREIVLVTGGSGGLGDLLVRKFAKLSIKVMSLDIVPPREPLPSNAFFYRADITSEEDIKRVADLIRQDHGDPTVIVNNAGIARQTKILEAGEEDLRLLFNVNVIALFLLAREFLPYMIKHDHGHIVTMASMASFVTGVQNVDYACTKTAALAFHEGLTQELRNCYGARRVRTSIIHPTYIRTPLIAKVLDQGKFTSQLLEPGFVVDCIIKQILSNKSGQVFLPNRMSASAGIRGWPHWLQELVRNSQAKVLQVP